MRLISSFSLALLIVTACTPLPAPAPADSGIEGNVTVGPMCPVVQVDIPCPDQPYQATLTVLTSIGHQKIVQFQTDANGVFRVTLVPGEYILHPESPGMLPTLPTCLLS